MMDSDDKTVAIVFISIAILGSVMVVCSCIADIYRMEIKSRQPFSEVAE